MFVKRGVELKLLEEQYASSGSNLVILYGRKGLGKTTLLNEFMEGKTSFYYEGVECVDRLQRLRMIRQWNKTSTTQDLTNIVSSLIKEQEQKAVLIFDEFHYIIKNDPAFARALLHISNDTKQVMLILCSSSIRWVENEMISSLGDLAASITAYRKLKEFTFVDFVNRFPKSSVEQCIYINAILGGVPVYLNEWQEELSVLENLQSILLDKDSRLFWETQQFLKQELREPAVYNTILSALAQGNRKLNDIYEMTGFSRAKISVYLKHLIQLDLVEKLVPIGEEGKENVKKGLYRIRDNFFSFWYRFIFPNLSELMLGHADDIYQTKIEPFLDEYIQEYFADVCSEFLKLMNLHQRLPEQYVWWDRWYGKKGTIDIMAQGQNGRNLVAMCLWEERQAEVEDYERLISLSTEAGFPSEYLYLFSKNGFTQTLFNQSKTQDKIKLIRLEDL